MVKEISVNVSKKIGQPNFGSAMLSASITTTVEDESETRQAFLEAWAMAWEEIHKQEEELRTNLQIEESVDEDPSWIRDREPTEEVDPSVCTLHQIKMEERVGKFGRFYSHSAKINGKMAYCNGKGYR